jgi:hypothetical protein
VIEILATKIRSSAHVADQSLQRLATIQKRAPDHLLGGVLVQILHPLLTE